MLTWVHIHLAVGFLLIGLCVSQIVINQTDSNTRHFDNLIDARRIAVRVEKQYYRRLVFNETGSKLYIGGREEVLTVDPNDLNALRDPYIFNTSETAKASCKTKNLLDGAMCYNFITIIQPFPDNLFVCGTDALSSKCYSIPQGAEVPELLGDFTGRVAPIDPYQNNTWLYMNGESMFLGVGMPLDGSGNSDGFRLANLPSANPTYSKGVKEYEDSKWLNMPDFVGDPIEYQDYVYFFFREFATEHINAGRIVYSRVGRVCKNDVGGGPLTELPGSFTTYQKARLDCSESRTSTDEFKFIYNEIQDIKLSKDGQQIVAIFTTSQKDPARSAICFYNLSEIAEIFKTSKFWGTKEAVDLWNNPATSLIPSPRPGQCDASYLDLTKLYTFQRHFSLLEKLVPMSRDSVVQKYVRYVQIDMDEDVGQENHTVMFIGTDKGTIIRVASSNNSAELIEEIDLNIDQPAPILTIIKRNKSMYIGTDYSVYKLPFHICSNQTTCKLCIDDPYCFWDGKTCSAYNGIGVQGNCTYERPQIKKYTSEGNDKDMYMFSGKMTNRYYAASAMKDTNIASKDISCDCLVLDMNSSTETKSVCGDLEIMRVQVSFIVPSKTSECTCKVTFTADDVDDLTVRMTSMIKQVDASMEEDCIKAIRKFDQETAKYKKELTIWKNNVINSTECTREVCNAEKACPAKTNDITAE